MRFRPAIRASCLGLVAFALTMAGGAPALRGAEPLSDAEALKPPTADRLTALLHAGESAGWDAPVAVLRATALQAYRANKLPAAAA